MTAPTGIVSVSDGPAITVRELVGNPLWIPTALKKMMVNQFISESLFRNGGANPNGVVAYNEGNPSFLEDDVADVAEFGEIPVSAGARGLPRTAFAVKKALGVRVSKEMIDENRVGAVNDQMLQLRNTFIRANDRSAKALLQSPIVPTLAVPTAWDNGGKVRTDIAIAIEQISTAAPTAYPAGVGSSDEYFGFIPDTIVMHYALLPILMDNENFMKVYERNANYVSTAPDWTGNFPGSVMGLNVIRSRTFPIDRVLIMERGTVGFYSDTRPLQFTALYPEGNGPNGGPTESYRADASHKRALAVDQPKAALWLTGIVTP
ncbi:major capsid protein [Mycobacterium phage Evanesce]|uniref:Major capsid protein n=14 Tax=Caudoviricetes TaxID=2731619 RepID=A0A385D0X7_9CAUD|nr:major head protein [Mycobacterium phage Giles]AHY84194.1 major capsid protein [Mycobacterium phage HH92]AKQ07785.1 major capsid protein [Mycobacterium phage Kinbote]ALA06653.1 major capsid protein [Mycobacterium phage OBUpride]ALF00230.1 major capsid protein [Mycobacterium phage Evanesce]ATN90398.1 major capsid protein [Mycobacterium phage LilHazelnut]AXQ51441.1 major capsid protein [Mycobacterium phage Amochick]QDH48749.1 major capsid protein [Mycobacterium phage DeepSoil15]QIQ62628.1 m